MKYYKVLRSNEGGLTFLTPQDSYMIALQKDEILKVNANTIWLKSPRFNNKWKESTTTQNAIECFLDWGLIKSIKFKSK